MNLTTLTENSTILITSSGAKLKAANGPSQFLTRYEK